MQIWESFHNFTKNERHAIRLLDTLRKSSAALKTYENVMHWHFVSNGDICQHQPVHNCSKFISREKLFDNLQKRYNYTDGYRNITKIVLPSSKSKAGIVWHDAKACMISLLTDPQITAKDYLFFGDGPLAPPPDQLNYIQDLNTGQAYLKMYQKIIKYPGKQKILPVIFYINATTTGQFC